MSRFAKTPEPPYYAVIFSNQQTSSTDGYGETANRMVILAEQQPGYLGIEAARDASGFGITISYWDSLEAIQNWRDQAEHQIAQERGKTEWYSHFELKVAKVEKAYGGPEPKTD